MAEYFAVACLCHSNGSMTGQDVANIGDLTEEELQLFQKVISNGSMLCLEYPAYCELSESRECLKRDKLDCEKTPNITTAVVVKNGVEVSRYELREKVSQKKTYGDWFGERYEIRLEVVDDCSIEERYRYNQMMQVTLDAEGGCRSLPLRYCLDVADEIRETRLTDVDNKKKR